MSSLFSALKKGAVGIGSGFVAVVGFVAQHGDVLPIPANWGPYIQFAGLIGAVLAHSPAPSKPDGK